MKVATWRGGNEFTVDDAPDPTPGPGDVLLKIDTCGICGTDVHITQGLFPGEPPTVLGHEWSGTIVDVGAAVDSSRIGQDVAPEPTPYCRQCWNCRIGRHSRCERIGHFQRTGGYAEYAVLPSAFVHDLPEGLSLADAAMGEPAAVCLVGLERCVTPGGSNMVVIGGGLIGQLTLAFAKARGMGLSILSDPVLARREQALRMGADMVHDPAAGPLQEFIAEVTDGRGIDFAVEAVGKPELVDLAIQVARPRGEVLILGVSPKGTTIPSDLFDTQYKELIIVNSFGRGDGYIRAINLLAEIDLTGVMGDRYPLHRAAEAMQAAASGTSKSVKTAIAPHMR